MTNSRKKRAPRSATSMTSLVLCEHESWQLWQGLIAKLHEEYGSLEHFKQVLGNNNEGAERLRDSVVEAFDALQPNPNNPLIYFKVWKASIDCYGASKRYASSAKSPLFQAINFVKGNLVESQQKALEASVIVHDRDYASFVDLFEKSTNPKKHNFEQFIVAPNGTLWFGSVKINEDEAQWYNDNVGEPVNIFDTLHGLQCVSLGSAVIDHRWRELLEANQDEYLTAFKQLSSSKDYAKRLSKAIQGKNLDVKAFAVYKYLADKSLSVDDVLKKISKFNAAAKGNFRLFLALYGHVGITHPLHGGTWRVNTDTALNEGDKAYHGVVDFNKVLISDLLYVKEKPEFVENSKFYDEKLNKTAQNQLRNDYPLHVGSKHYNFGAVALKYKAFQYCYSYDTSVKLRRLKMPHMHILLHLNNHLSLSAKSYARALGIDAENMVELYRSRGNSYLNGLAYLTHNSTGAVSDGKTQYPIFRVVSTMDYKKRLKQYLEGCKAGADNGAAVWYMDYPELLSALEHGEISIYDVSRENSPLAQRLRSDAFNNPSKRSAFSKELAKSVASRPDVYKGKDFMRENVYVFGSVGGIGKSLYGKALARKWVHTHHGGGVFEGKTSKNAFDDYTFQKAMVLHEFRSNSALELFGNASNLLNFLDPYADSLVQSTRYHNTPVLTQFNVLDSTQDPVSLFQYMKGASHTLGSITQFMRRFSAIYYLDCPDLQQPYVKYRQLKRRDLSLDDFYYFRIHDKHTHTMSPLLSRSDFLQIVHSEAKVVSYSKGGGFMDRRATVSGSFGSRENVLPTSYTKKFNYAFYLKELIENPRYELCLLKENGEMVRLFFQNEMQYAQDGDLVVVPYPFSRVHDEFGYDDEDVRVNGRDYAVKPRGNTYRDYCDMVEGTVKGANVEVTPSAYLFNPVCFEVCNSVWRRSHATGAPSELLKVVPDKDVPEHLRDLESYQGERLAENHETFLKTRDWDNNTCMKQAETLKTLCKQCLSHLKHAKSELENMYAEWHRGCYDPPSGCPNPSVRPDFPDITGFLMQFERYEKKCSKIAAISNALSFLEVKKLSVSALRKHCSELNEIEKYIKRVEQKYQKWLSGLHLQN